MKYIILFLVFISFISCDNDKWEEIQLEKYNCSFKLPFDSYKTKDRIFRIEGIGKIKCHEITIKTENTSDPNAGYEFECFEYPEFDFYANDSIINEFYLGTIENVLIGYNASKITEEIINYNGNPGIELYFKINDTNIYGFWRSYIIDNKQYSFTVFTKSMNLFNSSTLKFLDSFKLIKE